MKTSRTCKYKPFASRRNDKQSSWNSENFFCFPAHVRLATSFSCAARRVQFETLVFKFFGLEMIYDTYEVMSDTPINDM